MSEDVKKRLRILLGDSQLVQEYEKKYGHTINISNIRELRQNQQKTANVGSGINASDDAPIGEDPVYELLLICPVCNNKEVKSYNLKAKSQKIVENKFLVPRYSGVKKFRKVNYNLLRTTVCDKCFFASPDVKDFTKVNEFTGKHTKSQLSVNHDFISRLRKSIDERTAFVTAAFPGENTAPFERPRSFDEGIMSLKLSLMRGEQERDAGFPYSHYKMGSYHLQIAELQRLAGRDNRDSIESANNEFQEAFDYSDCPDPEIEIKTLYLLVGTFIKLGQAKKAGGYLKFFDESIKELNDAMGGSKNKARYKKQISSVDSWKSRTMNLWEYRDDKEFWKDISQ
jgi:uncharacterized protein (DUF2225 family)